jgi:hypothetical protein
MEGNQRRRPRYKRTTSDDDLGLRLQDRDREMLTLVYSYRFLSSQQIQRLVEGSDQVLLRRLQKLYHAGYLDRLKTSNNEAILYALGNKGADELTLHAGLDRGRIDWTAKNRAAGERYLAHILMVGRFRETLTLAVRDRQGSALVAWRPEGRVADEVVIESGREGRAKAAIIPDGFFTLQDLADEMHFLLECDRSTMTTRRYLEKMKAYWSFWKQAKHKSQLGIESFRVLTVTKTEERKENLRRITKEADDRKSGSPMFWFASEARFSPENPASIFAPIWQSAKDDMWHHLLE